MGGNYEQKNILFLENGTSEAIFIYLMHSSSSKVKIPSFTNLSKVNNDDQPIKSIFLRRIFTVFALGNFGLYTELTLRVLLTEFHLGRLAGD